MKKLYIAATITLSVLILASGCSKKSEPSSTLNSKPKTNVSSNTAGSEIITSTNPMEYKSNTLGFSFIFPKSWDNKYTVKEDSKGVTVYFKSKTKDDGDGWLFSILKKSNDLYEDTYDIVSKTRYFKAKGITYVIGGPTDVELSDTNPELKTYTKMHSQIDTIIRTLKTIDTK